MIPFVHCYLVVNIYTLEPEDSAKPLDEARKLRDKLNANYKHPDHYPKNAKEPYIIVAISEGEVVE